MIKFRAGCLQLAFHSLDSLFSLFAEFSFSTSSSSKKNPVLAMSSLYPEMRFSWEIKSVDALFCNGLTKVGDLSREGILQVNAGRIISVSIALFLSLSKKLG